MRYMPLLILCLAFVLPGCNNTPPSTAEHADEQTPEPRESLPRVLIIGDSISQGYQQTVRAELDGVAQVSRNPGNAEWTGTGVEKLDGWLAGDTQWDVIHFNWGLWDMYGWEYADRDRSPQAYGQRLEQLVARLKQTGATLIWATTTPACPEPEITMARRFNTEVVIPAELEQRYLDTAEAVMRRHGVRINDLHGLVKPDLARYAVQSNNVHFTHEGSVLLGKQVAEAIKQALADE